MTVLQMPVVHNKTLEPLIAQKYSVSDIDSLTNLLNSHKALALRPLENELYSAASNEESTDYTGYDNVWVRDNIHVAHAKYIQGQKSSSARTIKTIQEFWLKYKSRWTDSIQGKVDTNDEMSRPHIRFNGSELKENEEKWSHAQNDAIGYFLWFYSKLGLEGLLEVDYEMVGLICLYHLKIMYWTDKDNGHWEEAKKVEASSIGCAAAGYKKLLELLDSSEEEASKFQSAYSKLLSELNLRYPLSSSKDLVSHLYKTGYDTLLKILPYESRDVGQERDTDAALLFLVYPLNILPSSLSLQILNDVTTKLGGEYGIRRYAGDSYWMADYKNLFSAENRTADFSDDMSVRDRLLKKGQEAQWCIFDSIVSCAYGSELLRVRNGGQSDLSEEELYHKQVEYFNRALGQVTGEECRFGAWKCPESYYLENGVYVVNDVCPLLWAQANLICGLEMMKNTADSTK